MDNGDLWWVEDFEVLFKYGFDKKGGCWKVLYYFDDFNMCYFFVINVDVMGVVRGLLV